jgi:hypothetical protein
MNDRDARLRQFFGGYFNQDWDIGDLKSWKDVVIQYIRENPRAQVLAVRGDLHSWLEDTASGRNTEEALPPEFGCDYDPTPDNLNDREWVRKIVEFISEQLGEDR